MNRTALILPTIILATVAVSIGAAVIRGRLAERRRLRQIRLRYAVLGAYMTGNRLATVIASALELHIEHVYRALAELETRGWLTTKLILPLPKDNDNRSPAVTATIEEYQRIQQEGLRVVQPGPLLPTPDPEKEDDDDA